MGFWQKQQDSKPSAKIPISTIVRPSSHDTSCSLPSHIVLTGSFSPSEHCLLTTRNFSAYNFLRFFYESPTFISFLTLRSGRHICLQTFRWHIFLARSSRSSRTHTQPLLEMLRKVAHKQLARTSLNNLVPIGRDRFGQQRGDRDLWPDGILSPLITDFRLHCAESGR